MVKSLSSSPLSLKRTSILPTICIRQIHQSARTQASISTYTPSPLPADPPREKLEQEKKALRASESPLARLPTTSILRSLFLSIFFTSPLLFKPGLAIFQGIANSSSPFLNPDRNLLLRAFIRPIVYDQFCAGKNAAEIKKTSLAVKALGFKGIVLCYSKEVQLSADGKAHGYQGKGSGADAEIKQWRDGTMESLEMIGEEEWLGIKMTGAGPTVTSALQNGEQLPAKFIEAMEEICEFAASKNCRIWIDAEQSAVQASIDKCTFDLMRKYNRGERALLYTTIQAYLKISREKVQRQLSLAAEEGWRSGIKLVRGAYISNDFREKIHDTKEDTDKSYNGIGEDLLRGTGFPVYEKHPDLQHDVILAGHNTYTIRKLSGLATELAASGKLKVVPDFAQLQGMADDVGCELAKMGEEAHEKAAATGDKAVFAPEVFKCLTWGSIQECMQYLTRRLVENRGAADRMREGAALMRKELRRRFLGV